MPDELKSLLWLADSLRNQGLAVEAPPDLTGLPWARGLTHKLVRLAYAPRSIAISPDGLRVAVGTKAGHIHTLSFSEERWVERAFQNAGHMPEGAGPDHYAIRSLCFVGNDVLLAGFGVGYFRAFNLAVAASSDQRDGASAKEMHGLVASVEPAPKPRPYLDQVQTLVSLVPSGAPPSDEVPVALGVTPGQNPYFFFLSAGGSARQEAPSVWFEDWPEKDKLVGGVWQRDTLWLLAENGALFSYFRSTEKRDAGRCFVPQRRVRIKPPPGGASFAGLTGGREWMAVQAGDHVTVIDPDSVPQRKAKAEGVDCVPDWLGSPGVTSLAVIRPFAKKEGRPTAENPIWMYIVSSVSGLVWVPWYERDASGDALDSDNAEGSNGPRSGTGYSLGGQLQIGNRMPFRSLAATGSKHVRRVAVGSLQGEPDSAPCYLVFATREEELALISFIEMETASERLARDLPKALASAPNRHELTSPGLTLWLARRRLYSTFDLPAEKTLRPRRGQRRSPEEKPPLPEISEAELAVVPFPPDVSRPPAWLSQLEAEDIDELARDLLQVLSELRRKEPDASRMGEHFESFRRWVFFLLLRAKQVDAALYPNLVNDLALKLHSGIDRRAGAGMDKFRMLGAALRKWITFGDSFGMNPKRLAEHAEWNWEAHRTIDGAVYASHLLNSRVDLLSESSFSTRQPNPGIWSLTVARAGAFSVQSHTDGRITACARDGTTLEWSFAGDRAGLDITGDRAAIVRKDAKELRAHLWYGPFSRALALVEQSDGRHLLVFGSRGWPGTGHSENGPSIHALLLRLSGERLIVESAAQVPKAQRHELFSLIVVPSDSPRPSTRVELLAGSLWGDDQREMPRAPFVHLTVDCDHASTLSITLDAPSMSARQWPGRSIPAPEECNHNPAGALALTRQADGSTWLFVGQEDGRIRLFERSSRNWLEIEHFGPLNLSSSVRALCVSSGGSDESGPTRLLAFGTSDGTIGVVPLDLGVLRGEPEKRDETAPPRSGPASSRPPPRAFTESHPLLVHSRESAEICGLTFYEDDADGDRPGAEGSDLSHDRAARLMALTRRGVICIYAVDLFRRRPERTSRAHRILPVPAALAGRSSVAGERLDHFNLHLEGRALAVLNPAGGETPALIVGASDGQVRFYELAAPKGTERRRALAHRCWRQVEEFEKSGEPVVKMSIGQELLLPWLRIAQVGSLHLVRYSLWVALRQQAAKVADALLGKAPFDERFKEYISSVERLADEVYHRQPFSKEPVKIIWEEGAKVANCIATYALESAEPSVPLLEAFTTLGRCLSGLCNQSVGYEQGLESRALIHSFNALMDWPSVVLLSFGAETPSHDDARRFITEELLQRRLFFHDPVVPLEALTAINSALMRALELTQRGALTAHARDFHFFDLIAMVGTLAERRMNELEGDHPLRTEIIRFFALSLLFVPDGVFALAATISECGLTETSRDVGKLVAEYANRTCLQLEKELGCKNLEPQRAQLARYAEYLKWRERSEAPSGPARPAANTNDLSDARVMEEAWKMTRAAAALRELFEPAGDAELDRWLDEDVPERDCLAHSRGCLRQLRHYRRELRSQLEKRPDAFDGESNRPRYPAARATCKEAEAFLKKPGRIFEPQRSKYLEIVERWQDYIQRQQEHPLPMLELVDSFNRHVYQATADDLAASLQELALRTVPLSFADLRESDRASSLRWLIRRGLHAHPLLLDVYERGIRLVEDAHLSGTLLAVAKSIASGIPIAKGAGRGSVGLEEIENRLRQLSNSNQLDFLPHFSGGYDSPVTGSLDVWDAILQEWTRNVRKYGATPQRRFFASWSRTDTSNTLSMQGDRAFSESLVEPYRSMELHRVVDRIGKDTGKPFGSSDERSNGFGLFLVFSLCRLVGLKARLELAQGFALPEEAPLVLRIEWTHRK